MTRYLERTCNRKMMPVFASFVVPLEVILKHSEAIRDRLVLRVGCHYVKIYVLIK